jgi:zinc D-Ala-D-Ala carboxypeptidase
MKRRDFVRLMMATSPLLIGGCSHLPQRLYDFFQKSNAKRDSDGNDLAETQSPQETPQLSQRELSDLLLKDDRAKSDYFSMDFPDDIFFRGEKFAMLQNLTKTFRAVQRQVGFGHFNLVGMDEFFYLTGKTPGIEPLTSNEKKFLEELFYFDANQYGFKGTKVLSVFTDIIKKSDAIKVPHTGHYLKKGESLEIYNKLRGDLGTSLILTSGLRGIAKQFHLFMEKGLESKGNMSKASRSLAPPGYSFHGRGDFDVGKVGFGLRNFTQEFAATDEYKRLLDLGYINIRYTQSNLLGVRFEPWHIKVES